MFSFAAECQAGAANGAFLNSIAAVKYQGWAAAGPTDRFAFASTARAMFSHGGLAPFLKGTKATVVRDAAFGITFELLRHVVSRRRPHVVDSPTAVFATNVGAAVCATVVSAPFNYVRNVQYASAPTATPTTVLAELRQLVCEVRVDASPWRTLQRKLRLGWGSLRVGVGMAIGAKVYEVSQNLLG